MIKINKDTPEVESALKTHWGWIKKNFRIGDDQPPKDAKKEVKSAFTRAVNRKKRLYELLGFISKEQKDDKKYFANDKDCKLKELICVEPSELRSKRDDPIFASLIVEQSEQVKEYNEKKKMLKNDPDNDSLQKEIAALEASISDDLMDYKQKREKSEEIQRLLGYEKLYSKNSFWNAYDFCKSLKLSVCPYCNRQYIFTAQNKNGKCECRPQLDHFYVKSKYPYLSCSFYNLIPSCPFCNEGKNDNDSDTIYPYLEEFGKNAVFRMDADEIEILKNDQKNFIPKAKYTVSIEKIFSNKEMDDDLVQNHSVEDYEKLVNNSNSVFHLETLYNAHQLDLKNLLVKYAAILGVNLEKYSEVYYGKKDSTEEEKKSLKKILLGLPLFFDDGDDYPLRKFKEDIINQLDKT